MVARRKPPPRWSKPAAEAGVVMVALALAFAAGAAGFIVGRETADDDAPAAAETAAGTTDEATTAETETTPTETTPTETGATTETNGDEPEADGEAVFASAGCGTCHTFEPAGASGTVGPALDETDLNEDEIAAVVAAGRGAMPSFEGQLSDAEIAAVAEYVDGG